MPAPITKMKANSRELEPEVEHILKTHRDRRVIVVGTTCTGKSTLLKRLKERGLQAHDMDELVFPNLTKEEDDAVSKGPWTPEVGKLMDALARRYVKVEPGQPVFGTVVFDCDLIVYLKINDHLLMERTRQRKGSFDDAKRMQHQIEQQVKASGRPVIEIML